MRLLILNYEYPPIGGGGSPVTEAICRELTRLGNQVDVVTMQYRGLPKFEQEERLRIFRVFCLRSARHICYVHELFTYMVSSFCKAFFLVRTNSYDLVHAHFSFPSGVVAYLLFKVFGTAYVITAHGSDVQGYNPERFVTLHRFLAPFWRVVLRNAKAITSPSHSLAELIERNNRRPIRIEIIPNGIQSDWIESGKKGPYILVVSRLFERKGIQYFLKALEGISLGYQIDIVGEGPNRSALEELIKTIPDTVIFHGWLDNRSEALAALYRRASIFVFSSMAENFPISLLEAMLSGAAIIATDIGACREVLGGTGRFIPPGDPLAIRKQLLDLTADNTARSDLGNRARQRVLEKFTWDRVGVQYHDLFSRLTQSDAPLV